MAAGVLPLPTEVEVADVSGGCIWVYVVLVLLGGGIQVRNASKAQDCVDV